MNMKQFKYVLVLAKERSFGKAADTLNISQPSLSQYIRKIEQQIGMELFDRTGGDVRLTDAGQVYIEAGKKILDLEHQMKNKFSDLATYKVGSVIVGTSPYRSAGMMPIVIKNFQKKYPGMHIVVEEMTTSELVDATEHGQFDLCLTMLPINQRLFSYERITEEEMVLAVPASYGKLQTKCIDGKKYPAIDTAQIDNEAFIMITENQVMQKALNNLCSDCGINLRKAAVVKSLEAQIAMVRAGVGMAFVPSGIDRFCSRDEVIIYSFEKELPKREIIAMWRKDRMLNQATRELLKTMKEIEW